jgi:hypothetical protein
MGRSTKERSNPALGKPHAVGDQVAVVQVLTHDRFGAIAYLWPRLWRYHYYAAEKAANHLTELHEKLLELEPGDNNMRLVSDDAFLQDMYGTGNEMVSHAVRAVQHLAEEIERAQKVKFNGKTAEDRINEAMVSFSEQSYSSDKDYAGFIEINGIRDALEHPQRQNTYSGDPNGWDKVPLAWMFSNRSLDAWQKFDRWFNRVGQDWEKHLPKLSTGPVTLTLQRGIESQLPVKKPRRAKGKPKKR